MNKFGYLLDGVLYVFVLAAVAAGIALGVCAYLGYL